MEKITIQEKRAGGMVYVVCWAALQYDKFLFNKPLLISMQN